MLGSPFPLQSQGWHELPSTRGFPKKPGAHLGGRRGQWTALAQALSALGPSNRPCPTQALPPSSPLTRGPSVAGFAETLGAAPSQDAACRKAAKMEVVITHWHSLGKHLCTQARPGTSWLHWPLQKAVLIQPGVGLVFRSGSIKTLGHQPTVGTRDGWPSLLVGRHGQGAGAADAGGCRVLGPSAHEAGLAALTVVTLSVVLAALGRGNSSAPTVEASLPPAPSPALQGLCPGHPPLPRPQHTHNHGPKGALAFPPLCLWCLLPTRHRAPLTTQTPEPGRQRSEWPWH